MALKLSINVTEEPSQGTGIEIVEHDRLKKISDRLDELVRQMGDQIAPFPDAGVDGFLSHFVITLQFLKGPIAGKTLTLEMPTSTQTVTRSAPFVYKGPNANHRVTVPLPAGCSLSNVISEQDFIERP